MVILPRINPEILSDKPTHRFNGSLVKVFSDGREGPHYDFQGCRVATAEIMEGPHKGKYTTVWFDELESVEVKP